MIPGKKVILRAIEESDLEQLKNFRNQPYIRKMCREYRLLNMENQRRWFHSLIEDKNTIMFAIETRSTKKLIGACGLTYIDWKNRKAESSIYGGSKNWQEDPLIVDALETLMKYAFYEVNLHKLYAEVFAFNRLTAKLLENCNFTKTGVMKTNHFEDGKFWDSYIYSILRDEYDKFVQS